MKIGTKSLLFGVHAFWVHPVVVGLAWHKLYRRWPTREEWLAIFFHDWGYWRCPNIDGPEGRLHPERSARAAVKIAKWLGWDAWIVGQLILGHSREYVKCYGGHVSNLCWPDKLSVIYEPEWFYLLRGWFSGETEEFRLNEVKSGRLPDFCSRRFWFRGYKSRVLKNPEIVSRLKKYEKSPLPFSRPVRGNGVCRP